MVYFVLKYYPVKILYTADRLGGINAKSITATHIV